MKKWNHKEPVYSVSVDGKSVGFFHSREKAFEASAGATKSYLVTVDYGHGETVIARWSSASTSSIFLAPIGAA